jgi:NAD(P)-dependent dehydrogenase (short-subunit alcohol dehydrogenase family)
VHGFQVIKGFFPYPVAKHAVLGLTRSLAIEYADTGVRINSVSPGAILTPLNDAIWAASADPAAERKRWEEQHPVKRLGTSEEVAALVAFLASDEAGFIIGENIVIDGGRSIVH